MNALYDFFQTDWTEQVDFMLFIYLVAITAEAMSGALAAGRRNMDAFGVAVIALSPPWAVALSAMWCLATTRLAGHSIQPTSISFWARAC